MSKPLPEQTTVVVATGEGAKFFTQDNGATEVSLTFSEDLEPGHLADQGPSGKSPPDMASKESMEATFSKILAQDLYRRAHDGQLAKLVLIADPGTLGEIRPLLHKEVTDRIILELDKTLVNAPVEDIERSIQAALD